MQTKIRFIVCDDIFKVPTVNSLKTYGFRFGESGVILFDEVMKQVTIQTQPGLEDWCGFENATVHKLNTLDEQTNPAIDNSKKNTLGHPITPYVIKPDTDDKKKLVVDTTVYDE